jgi:hypothetical protein
MEKFWMVWNENNMIPVVRHLTEGSARDEAERLARKHPGQEFHILKYAGSCRKVDVIWEGRE